MAPEHRPHNSCLRLPLGAQLENLALFCSDFAQKLNVCKARFAISKAQCAKAFNAQRLNAQKLNAQTLNVHQNAQWGPTGANEPKPDRISGHEHA